EAEAVPRRHAEFFAALAEAAEPSLYSGARQPGVQRLTLEQDNLRAVLRWSAQHAEPAGGGAAVGPRWVWLWGETGGEGRRWAEDLLRMPGASTRTPARAKALFAAGALAFGQGDFGAVRARCEESAAIARELGDRRLQALAMAGAGSVMLDDLPAGRA